MGHILTKYKVIVPRFNTYFITNSIAQREHLLCGTFLVLTLQRHPTFKIALEWPLNLTTYVI